jgi:hypothetical protein
MDIRTGQRLQQTFKHVETLRAAMEMYGRALEQAGRRDLIGSGCDCLIPEKPPKEAIDRKRCEATQAFTEATSGDHIRGGPRARRAPRNRTSVGYRPKRKGT